MNDSNMYWNLYICIYMVLILEILLFDNVKRFCRVLIGSIDMRIIYGLYMHDVICHRSPKHGVMITYMDEFDYCDDYWFTNVK